jgi:peroxiredoxin
MERHLYAGPLPFALSLATLLSPVAFGAAPEEAGRIGVQLQIFDSALLITDVVPGSGAAAAGLLPGERIVAVDGVPVSEDARAARERIRGAPGQPVQLSLAGAYGGTDRQLQVLRQMPPPGGPPALPRGTVPEVVRDFRHAVVAEGRCAARREAQDLLDARFGGMSPSSAVGNYLRAGWRRRPAVARAAADVLAEAQVDDVDLLAAIADVYLREERWEQAAELLLRAQGLARPDLRWPDGRVGDLGGELYWRKALVTALLRAGRREEALEPARALSLANDLGPLAAELGLTAAAVHQSWAASLPASPEIRLRTLAGEDWSLEAHRGRVVVLAFWATWCGPCKEELPELMKLWSGLKDQGLDVLAVSVDASEAGLGGWVERLGLGFPVAHHPALGEQMGVSAIPALRVLSRDGAVIYEARGYSPAGVARLREVVERALAQKPGGSEIAVAGGRARASLRRFVPLAGATGLSTLGGKVTVGVRRAGPALYSLSGEGELEADMAGVEAGNPDLMGWLGGPVGAERGGLWLRAWDEGGSPRWLRSTSSPIRDMVVLGTQIAVATEDGQVLRIGSDGALLSAQPWSVTDLEPEVGDGLLGLGSEGLRRWAAAEPGPGPAQELPGALRLASGGVVATRAAEQLVCGRFGQDQSQRCIAWRGDNRVVGLDAEGRAAFVLQLRGPGSLAVGDAEGDGHDELYVLLEDQGWLLVDLSIP